MSAEATYGSLSYLKEAHAAARGQAEALRRLYDSAAKEERRLAGELQRLKSSTRGQAPAEPSRSAQPPGPAAA